jgi:DNA-directed RNA polymerase subunit RPC12/RpoP
METEIQLLCSECNASWSRSPESLPDHDEPLACPDCGTDRPTAEFARTERDLRTLKQFEA